MGDEIRKFGARPKKSLPYDWKEWLNDVEDILMTGWDHNGPRSRPQVGTNFGFGEDRFESEVVRGGAKDEV